MKNLVCGLEDKNSLLRNRLESGSTRSIVSETGGPQGPKHEGERPQLFVLTREAGGYKLDERILAFSPDE